MQANLIYIPGDIVLIKAQSTITYSDTYAYKLKESVVGLIGVVVEYKFSKPYADNGHFIQVKLPNAINYCSVTRPAHNDEVDSWVFKTRRIRTAVHNINFSPL